jgi:hypothetical protein
MVLGGVVSMPIADRIGVEHNWWIMFVAMVSGMLAGRIAWRVAMRAQSRTRQGGWRRPNPPHRLPPADLPVAYSGVVVMAQGTD